jgi:hypothetical protein
MDNEQGEAKHFVDAMDALSGRQCEEREWRFVGPLGRFVPGRVREGKETFCSMSNQLQIRKEDIKTGNLISNLRVGVNMELDEPEDFDWCSVLGLGSTIAGPFDRRAGLSSAFGVAQWLRDLVPEGG